MKIDSNTVVFITGGQQGLGYASAKHLASKGASIFIVDLDKNKLEVAAEHLCRCQRFATCNPTGSLWHEQVKTISPRRVEYMVCDVSIPEQVEAAINKCVTVFGKIDVALACAGIATYSCTYNKALNAELDLNICERTMKVNFFGSLHLAKYASKVMSKNVPNERKERGLICLTSSICATEGLSASTPYSCSKAAINGMVLPMCRDLSHLGIRINSINAGTIETNMQIQGIKDGYGVDDPEQIKKFQKDFIDRYYPPATYDNIGQGTPEDFAKFVESIIVNPFLNGAVLRMDGGMRM